MELFYIYYRSNTIGNIKFGFSKQVFLNHAQDVILRGLRKFNLKTAKKVNA